MFTTSGLFCILSVLVATYVKGLDLTDDMVECLGVKNTVSVESLDIDLFPSGMVRKSNTSNINK